MNDRIKPYKVKKCREGRLGEYVWNGLYIIKHPDDNSFWKVQSFGNHGPSIERKFKNLHECCMAIDYWYKVRDKKHLRLVE